MTIKNQLQHIYDRRTGESYFAIVRWPVVVRPLRQCANWREAKAAFKSFVA